MKPIYIVALSCLVLLSLISPLKAAEDVLDDYLGEWQTIDDKTNLPRSIVTVSVSDGVMSAKITQLIRQPGEEKDPLCKECDGDLHNAKITGMQILDKMTLKKNKWQGGEILDPNNGKFYDCKIWIEDGVLMVRGYLGFFYRTQQWTRVNHND